MHITRLEFAPASLLEHTAHDTAIAVLADEVEWQELPLTALAQVEQSDTVENNLRTTEVRLTATLRCPGTAPEASAGPYAFRLTEADGTRWLLGTAERPHTRISLTQTRAAQPSEQSAEKLSVQLKGRHGLLSVVGGGA